MSDPFFDEDDGEFDDLYGNPPPAAPSPSRPQKPRNSPPSAAQPSTPGGRPSTRSPAGSSSVVSRSYARDRAGSAASNATDLATSGKQDKRRRRHGKARRKDSQELFDVQWQSDVAVSKCGLCRADFSLVRRKHHCRHCGRVMCSDCSSFLFFEFSHRKHRVCAACNNQLLAEQDAYDREARAGGAQQRDTASNLFDDSSDDGRPSVAEVTPASSTPGAQQTDLRSSLANAFTPKHNGDDEKARKKQEKKERKERKKREKLEKTGTAVPIETMKVSRRQADGVEEKPTTNGAALFDGADDDWFTDVPDQRTRARGSGAGRDEEGSGSKGPGWGDRVNDTYTITPATEQPSVLVPMTGSTLTAGITGKGYISDQFRYDDVGGPGLGHDDDLSVEMPRPKQQATTMTYANHSVEPSRLTAGITAKGYISDQFRYDDVGGPGLGHDNVRSVAMPRPKQQASAAPSSYDGARPNDRHSQHTTTDESTSYERDFQPRHTFKDNLKDIFSGTKRRESTTNKTEKKSKASKPRARGNENMTLDELNPSFSSEDEPRMLASAMPRTVVTPAQPTFYDDDADKLVVDDSPGFFEATLAEREVQRKQEEQQKQQLAKDMAWVNESALPPTVPPHRFSSEQDSYSIVDPPSHTSNSPVENQRRSRTAGGTAGDHGNAKGGFTGALKRFFGMGSKTTEKTTTPPKPAKAPPTVSVAPPEMNDTENTNPSVTSISQITRGSVHEAATGRLERHTVMDYYVDTREESAPQENARFSMAGYVDSNEAHARFEASMPTQVSGSNQTGEVAQRMPERKRRGTFDDLFESPKNNASTDRFSSTGANGWAATTAAGRVAIGASAVGVSRFDQRRSIDEADELSFEVESQSVQPPARSVIDSTETWRQSAAMSLLDDRKDAGESGFTWSNVRSAPGLGTATYAVPTSLQSRAGYDEDRGSSFQYNASPAQPAPLGNIMDDLKRSATSKQPQRKESIDDFFAEFEEPNDYVFDPTTGGYVAARVPPRAVAARPVSRSESTELEAPQAVPDMIISGTSGRNYYALSEPVVRPPTANSVVSKDAGGEEVDDEVAEIIVDKISSLESELAALKQLIRSRKGGGGNSQIAKPHKSPAKSSGRKESIFDNDSSDEENDKPSDPYSTSVRPPPNREGKHRPGSKKKNVKKRKDSFADLFEDSPNEAETLGGATSYEALFQTGAAKAEAGQGESSDNDGDFMPQPAKVKTKKSRRRSSRKINDFVATKVESDSDPEFASLKGRRVKQSFRRDTNNGVDSVDVKLTTAKSDDLLTTPLQVDVVPVFKPVKKLVEEEDPIDALFDTSDDHDVAKLYGGENTNVEKDTSSMVEPQSAQTTKDPSFSFTQSSSGFLSEEEGGNALDPVVNASSVAPTSREFSGHLNKISLDEAKEDEDFEINWEKMRKTKTRRRKSRLDPLDSSVNSDESVSADNDMALEPTLLGTRLDDHVNHEEATASVSSGFLADAASNWMSVTTLENETADFSLTGDEDLSSLLGPVDEGQNAESRLKNSPIENGKDGDDADLTPIGVSAEFDEPTTTAARGAIENSGLTRDNDPVVDDLSNSIGVHTEAKKAEPLRELGATFDIFDRSGDVNFLSMTAPMNSKTFDHEREDVGSEDDDRGSSPDEDGGFSFEIKAPKKRTSVLDDQTGSSVSEHVELSSPSPSSSADDNLELGKYVTSSVPSSTAPSVDGSVDDPEDVSVDDESVLGKVESQAFDTDWNQMQVKEKERKKRLQAKQRQAQRDKVLRKQGTSAKSLTGSSTPHGSSKSKSKTGKKKKKEKENDTAESSHHKKSGSSRKHRHREKGDADGAVPSDPPRSLTEL